MNPSTAPIPSLALDVYWPMMKSAALITAGELGIFAALSPGPLPVEELAGRLGTSIQGTDRLCAVLTQTGYLERTPENRLGNSPHAQAWLTQSGQQDWTSGLRWFGHAWQLMSGVREAVVRGSPAITLWDRMHAHPGMGQDFAAYMKDYAASVVEDVQRAIHAAGEGQPQSLARLTRRRILPSVSRTARRYLRSARLAHPYPGLDY